MSFLIGISALISLIPLFMLSISNMIDKEYKDKRHSRKYILIRIVHTLNALNLWLAHNYYFHQKLLSNEEVFSLITLMLLVYFNDIKNFINFIIKRKTKIKKITLSECLSNRYYSYLITITIFCGLLSTLGYLL